ncbi:MAG: ankyrin repeat domain-containing protein [Rivularia sp. (in: cyanobacteria)]
MSINTENESESNSVDIYKIIEAGDIAGVRDFIASGADINQVDKNSGWTPLEIAAEKGKVEIAKILIEAGAIVDKPSLEPLELAASNGFTEIVSLLIQAGDYASKEKNKRFHEALFMPIVRGQLEIVKAFVAVGADVNYLWTCGSGLHYAMQHNRLEIIEFFLANGADVNILEPEEDGKKWTPLMEAARTASSEIARILIDKGADVNAKDIEGKTPLIIAAEFGNAEVAGELILAGADIDAKDNKGHSALMYASIVEPHDITEPIPDLEELERISSEGGNSLEDKFKQLEKLGNILSNIEVTGRVNIAKMLRVAGASQQGLSVNDLIKAAEKANLTELKNLIKAGVDVDSFNYYGQTALIAAVNKNHIDIVTTLIEAGADINLGRGGSNNHTPLMEAAYGGHNEIVQLLIQAGADVNLHTDYGITAIYQAQRNGNPEIIKLLRDSGARNYHEIPVSQWRGIDSIRHLRKQPKFYYHYL